MKLKEQFDNVEVMFENQIGTLKYDELSEASNQCVIIADDFAIGFVEWKDKISNADLRYSQKYAKSNEELLQIYKKEKGL